LLFEEPKHIIFVLPPDNLENKSRVVIMKKTVILIVFGLSGAAALIYEVVWSRLLQVIFGCTVYTASTIFAAFLLGLSIGSFLFRKIADETKQPLFYLALFEVFIGLYGIGIIYLFKLLSWLYLFLPSLLIIKLVLCLIVLLPPTILFGAVWPFINRYYINDVRKLGSGTGNLYSANSIGSAFGAFAGGFIFVPFLGFRTTSIIAALLNIAAGLLLIIVWKKESK